MNLELRVGLDLGLVVERWTSQAEWMCSWKISVKSLFQLRRNLQIPQADFAGERPGRVSYDFGGKQGWFGFTSSGKYCCPSFLWFSPRWIRILMLYVNFCMFRAFWCCRWLWKRRVVFEQTVLDETFGLWTQPSNDIRTCGWAAVWTRLRHICLWYRETNLHHYHHYILLMARSAPSFLHCMLGHSCTVARPFRFNVDLLRQTALFLWI